MKNLACWALLFVVLCSSAVRAAEFLILDSGADLSIPVTVMTDSSSIKNGETGHKLATLLYVHEASEWDDRQMELDCTTQRWRELGGGRHHLDGSVSPESPDDNWTDLQGGSAELRIRDAICAWPDKRPGDDRIITGDLRAVIDQVSAVVSKIVAESQRERDGEK